MNDYLTKANDYLIARRKIRWYKRIAFCAEIVFWGAFMFMIFSLASGHYFNAFCAALIEAAMLLVVQLANSEIHKDC